MIARSKKTERYEGKDKRVVPQFPELRPHLGEAFESAEPGPLCVIRRDRDAGTNLQTPLERIIDRAGVDGWPKLFQHLRSNGATESAAEHPAHVAADWVEHSTLVA